MKSKNGSAALGGLAGAAWGDSACILIALAGFLLQAAMIMASAVAALRTADGGMNA